MEAALPLAYAHSPMTSKSDSYRWWLAGACVLLVACSVGWTIWNKSTFPPLDVLGDLPYNDQILAAIQVRLSQSSNVFELLVLITAALVGVFITRKPEGGVTVNDRPELIMTL